MSKAKYTPGNWKRIHLSIKDERGMVIAEVAPPDRRLSSSEQREEMEWCKGNGNLISAAPDLEKIVYRLVKDGLSTGLVKDATAALNKAWGKTK